jgi:tRNA(fMet)-specific endonuclease VapC
MRRQRGRSARPPPACCRAGRTPAARSYDAVIAAMAVSNDLPLSTCSIDDFAAVGPLHVIDVPHPDT